MPPKKKRGGQSQVILPVVGKMSTRSRKNANTNTKEKAEPPPKLPKPKAPPKKAKAAAVKPKPKKPPVKRKAKPEPVVPVESVEEPQTPVEEPNVEPSEPVFEESPEPEETSVEQSPPEYALEAETEMEAETSDNVEGEFCEIAQQLEALEVSSEETDDIHEVVYIEEALDQSDSQIIEIEGDEYAEVEYITEEFVPIADDAEIVIEEEEEEIEEIKDVDMTPRSESETEVIVLAEEVMEQAPVQEQKEEVVLVQEQEVKSVEKEVEKPKVEEIKEVIEKPKASKKRPPKKETKKTPRKPKTPKKPKETEKQVPPKKEEPISDKTEEVRRSSRIKSISVLKQRSRGHGLVKSAKAPVVQEPEMVENRLASVTDVEKPVDSPSHNPMIDMDNKPVKVKSRWRLSSELEMNVLTPAAVVSETQGDSEKIAEATAALLEKAVKTSSIVGDEEVDMRLKQFVHLKENLYLTDRMCCKEAKKMTCDCFLTPEEIERGEFGCGEDCLNRLLMIECGNLCPVGERCTNKKFQKAQFAPVEVFKTEKKGLGLRAAANIPYGEFILEYVGEVLDPEEFDSRADDYSKDKNRHYYFMSLRADAIIDATVKGNISRFINHSCDPNAETQKWTVNGELRIGFFSTRTILAGEEITFDYRFQRYGKEAQKCYCEAPTCRGWLGEEPEDEDDEEEDEEEEEEEIPEEVKVEVEVKVDEVGTEVETQQVVKPTEDIEKPVKKTKKRTSPKKKPRKDKFEDLDQLDEEIEMLVTTGLKNQAHTLKLSRLMVRAKEPAQRTKLLRILRRGELPCRRLFLDYHGLRLMHGYMTDAQYLAKTDTKFESLRLEMVQTLATLPIPNKTMLQDSKVLPTVENWSLGKSAQEIPLDSDSNSPQAEEANHSPAEVGTAVENPKVVEVKVEEKEIKQEESGTGAKSVATDFQEDKSFTSVNKGLKGLPDEVAEVFSDVLPRELLGEVKDEKAATIDEPNYEEEIIALALKLLEEWSNLKEVFKIPKKERIEQMKEHEREANRGYIAGLGLEQDAEKKNESRYRFLKRYRSIEKVDNCNSGRKNIKLEDRTIVNFPKLGRDERRKMFALQVEQHEEERRRKQREMWRQHEQHCFLLGTDPRLTAPFDPNRGYQCIWNPQIGQWQNYPIQNPNVIFNAQGPPSIPPVMPTINMPPPPNPTFPPYLHQPNLHVQNPPLLHPGNPACINPVNPGCINQGNPVNPIHPLPSLPYQEDVKKPEDYTEVKFMGPIPPPAKLPPKWKCAKDKYGRPYYYHIKIRKSQWEPPPLPPPVEEPDESSETTSSSDTSSLSSETSSEEDSDDELNDSKLLIDVRRQMEKQAKTSFPKPLPTHLKVEENDTPSPLDDSKELDESTTNISTCEEVDADGSSIDARLKEILKEEKCQQPPTKKRRSGLVHEIIISPRTEEDRQQFREDLKRYKQNKEKLKREKVMILQQTKKHIKEKRHKSTVKAKMKEMTDSNSRAAKNIKETFRSNMATVVVSVLNSYRKPDCKEGRITNTDDFKHLARKLTHFVMLKEMKHIEKIEDLVCTDNVKAKAREYIKKYMSKFGESYQKRNDEPDF